MWKLFGALFVLNVVSEVFCSNLTEGRYQKMHRGAFKTRQNRLISFSDEGDVQLDLDFNVPFITLPIKKSLDIAKTSLVSLNVGSVILAGIIVFGAAVVIPLLLTFFNKKGLIPAQSPLNYVMRMGTYRSEDSEIWRYLSIIDNKLMENQIDVTSCSQRILCLTVKNSLENVSKGKGSSFEKIIDGLASNKWLQENLPNSLFKKAITYGMEDRNCTLIYGNCKINPETVFYFLKRFLGKFSKG